jgi:plasmid maintenance system antidote protein VapI
MVKNNIEVDVKVKCIEQGKTQEKLAEEIETTKAYVNRVIKKNDSVVNNTFVKMMEALGYDIELHYVKRDESE